MCPCLRRTGLLAAVGLVLLSACGREGGKPGAASAEAIIFNEEDPRTDLSRDPPEPQLSFPIRKGLGRFRPPDEEVLDEDGGLVPYVEVGVAAAEDDQDKGGAKVPGQGQSKPKVPAKE